MHRPERPLSPHLQIYKPQLTSVMSILHRMTGIALSIGLIFVTWWLVAVALGPAEYERAMRFAVSPLGQILLFGWSVALYYHLFNGIRHLIWDTGYLFELKNVYAAGYVVLALTVVATLATWWCVYGR